MTSKGSWIDPDELARLGAELAGGEVPAPPAEEGGPLDLFGEEVDLGGGAVGGGSPGAGEVVGELERAGQRLAAIRRRAERSGLLRPMGEEADGVEMAAVVPGEGASLVDRLESFVRWASEQKELTGLFITDFAGNELVESGAAPSLVTSGVALADGWERARGELETTAANGVSTAASVRDRDGAVLTVFSCRSAYGRHVLGVLSGEPLAAALSGGLRSGFARVMGQGGEAG